MRNIAPSILTTLPRVEPLSAVDDALNARWAARRAELDAQLDAALLTGRVMVQPTMAWIGADATTKPRTQPRGPNGRFLSRSWLADAELFLPSDRAFFRRPLSSTSTEGY